MPVAVTTLLIVLLAACGPAAPEVGRLEAAIAYGQLTDDYPSTGALVAHLPGGEKKTICSGNLVGSHTVLTATHCVTGGDEDTFSFELADGSIFDVVAISTASLPSPFVAELQGGLDLAALRLDRAPDVTPTPVALDPPRVGTLVKLVGYGLTHYGSDDVGHKRVGDNRVFKVQDDHIQYVGGGKGRGAICYGDSGGPTFATIRGQPVQIGVHSFGVSRHYGLREFDGRLDTHSDWLERTTGGDVTLIDAQPGAICDSEDPELLARECVQGCTVSGYRDSSLGLVMALAFCAMAAARRRSRRSGHRGRMARFLRSTGGAKADA